MPEKIVGLWFFDENFNLTDNDHGTTIADESIYESIDENTKIDRIRNGNHGILPAGMTTRMKGGGLEFENNITPAIIPPSASLHLGGESFTVEVWINLRDLTKDQYFVSRRESKRDSATYYGKSAGFVLEFAKSDKTFRFGIGNNGGMFVEVKSDPIDKIKTGTDNYYLAGVYDIDKQTIQLKVDNQPPISMQVENDYQDCVEPICFGGSILHPEYSTNAQLLAVRISREVRPFNAKKPERSQYPSNGRTVFSSHFNDENWNKRVSDYQLRNWDRYASNGDYKEGYDLTAKIDPETGAFSKIIKMTPGKQRGSEVTLAVKFVREKFPQDRAGFEGNVMLTGRDWYKVRLSFLSQYWLVKREYDLPENSHIASRIYLFGSAPTRRTYTPDPVSHWGIGPFWVEWDGGGTYKKISHAEGICPDRWFHFQIVIDISKQKMEFFKINGNTIPGFREDLHIGKHSISGYADNFFDPCIRISPIEDSAVALDASLKISNLAFFSPPPPSPTASADA